MDVAGRGSRALHRPAPGRRARDDAVKIKNGLIEVRQEKTGRYLVIPAHQKLLAVLATMKSDSRAAPHQHARAAVDQVWVQGELAEGPAEDGRWRPSAIAAGLVFHGLRKSAVVMLLEVGCTTAEVQAITGQSMQMVEHYAKQVNQKKLAASAILKWENAPRTEFVQRAPLILYNGADVVLLSP